LVIDLLRSCSGRLIGRPPQPERLHDQLDARRDSVEPIIQATERTEVIGNSAKRTITPKPSRIESVPESSSSHSPLISVRSLIAAAISRMPAVID
jgi:hypothetical protein